MVNNWATSFSHYKNRGFRWFFGSQLSVCVLFLFPVICQFSKNSLFQKKGAKIGLFNFQCFQLIFWKCSFFGLLKHYQNRGFSKFGFFCCWKRRNRQKNDNWNLWILAFFCPKMAVLWRTSAFQKKSAWNPYFYSVFGMSAFWAKVSKKGNFEKPPKKWKKLTDNWKAIFWYFCFFFGGGFFFLVFFCFFLFSLFFFVFVFFFGGFKGQVRWPEGPPHLALNPP